MKIAKPTIAGIAPRRGFTMIEIMIVVAIIGIIIAIASHTWLRQREISRARACQENLTKIDGAKEQYALENNTPEGSIIATGSLDDIAGPTNYIKNVPFCPAGGIYSMNVLGENPTCDYATPPWMPNDVGHFMPTGGGGGS